MLIQGFSIYAAIKFSETKATEKPFEFCSMIFVAGLIVV
jgi:hypothetical protein